MCVHFVRILPGAALSSALIGITLRVQQAGRATTTILSLGSGESRALPPRGSILPIYRSGDVGLDHPCVRAVRLESGYCRELLGGRTRGRVPTSRAFYHPRPGRSAGEHATPFTFQQKVHALLENPGACHAVLRSGHELAWQGVGDDADISCRWWAGGGNRAVHRGV